MKNRRLTWPGILISAACSLLFSCGPSPADTATEEHNHIVTPVTVVHPQTGPLASYIELNATSSFLKKDFIKSTANGYITDTRITIGQQVKKGDILFVLQTKESRALADFRGAFDSTLKFNGYIDIRSPKDGIVNAISHQKGDYVQDAEQLAMVSEPGSLVFLIDVPFELHQYLSSGRQVNIVLPDSEKLTGTVSSGLPSMDVTSQTQNYIITPAGAPRLPEGLIARIRIPKIQKDKAVTVPKSAVLTDEKQQQYWVMKLTNDTTAVKVVIKKGIETPEKVEIVSPVLSPSDRIVATGNYGLPDTAFVKTARQE